MARFESHPLFPGDGVPFFIAAGPLKDGPQLEPFSQINDPLVVPVLTSGGWTLSEWSGNATSKNPTDFVYYPERRMAGNARGLPNNGLEGMRRLRGPLRRLSDKGIKTILQVTNLPHEKPVDVIPILVEAAAELEPTAVEVNLSCPNGLDAAGNLHPPTCNDPEASAEVMSMSRLRVGKQVCLGAKDSPHAGSLEDEVDEAAVTSLIQVAINPFVDFLTGINTIGGQPFPEITCAGGKGGMSGPVVATIARGWLSIARSATDAHIPILSCGGVVADNLVEEANFRLENGAMLVGGAQEFFRTANPVQLALRWAQEYAETLS